MIKPKVDKQTQRFRSIPRKKKKKMKITIDYVCKIKYAIDRDVNYTSVVVYYQVEGIRLNIPSHILVLDRLTKLEVFRVNFYQCDLIPKPITVVAINDKQTWAIAIAKEFQFQLIIGEKTMAPTAPEVLQLSEIFSEESPKELEDSKVVSNNSEIVKKTHKKKLKKMDKLTPGRLKYYLRKTAESTNYTDTFCPFCGNTDGAYYHVKTKNEEIVEQYMYCEQCGKKWQEVTAVINIIDMGNIYDKCK